MNVGQYGQSQMGMNGQGSYANGNAADYQQNMPHNGGQDMHGNVNQVTGQKITKGDDDSDSDDNDGKHRKENDDDESDPQFEPEGGEGEEENKNDGDAGQANNAHGGNQNHLGNIK